MLKALIFAFKVYILKGVNAVMFIKLYRNIIQKNISVKKKYMEWIYFKIHLNFFKNFNYPKTKLII